MGRLCLITVTAFVVDIFVAVVIVVYVEHMCRRQHCCEVASERAREGNGIEEWTRQDILIFSLRKSVCVCVRERERERERERSRNAFSKKL